MFNEIYLALNNLDGNGSNEGVRPSHNNDIISSNWSPLPQGYIKINVDEATRPVGVATVVARDQMGKLIEGSSKIIVGGTMEETKAWDILLGL
jgi:hypothetical protein